MGVVNYTVVNGEILSENRNGVKRDYVPDPLGSTVALLDNTNSKTDTFEYWPYGEVRTRSGTTLTPFQFMGTLGYYKDDATRTYVRARVLRTLLGRWMTEDPVLYSALDWNLLCYTANNPTTLRDPTGKLTETLLAAFGPAVTCRTFWPKSVPCTNAAALGYCFNYCSGAASSVHSPLTGFSLCCCKLQNSTKNKPFYGAFVHVKCSCGVTGSAQFA